MMMRRHECTLRVFLGLLLLVVLPTSTLGGTPAPEQFFSRQKVDHLKATTTTTTSSTTDCTTNNNNTLGNGCDCDCDCDCDHWTQRYYTWEKEFGGPGYPIFMIMGGEGEIPPTTGLFYPFVTHHLAKIFRGFVLEPEHRFYGKSQPLKNRTTAANKEEEDEDPRIQLFTSEQALLDAILLLDHIKEQLGCSNDRFSKDYCPVITVGGSYPGWLSAMARLVYPQKVDMAYAASAPMLFYSQQVDQYAYYNLITQVAEQTKTGCANAVRSTLLDAKQKLLGQDMIDNFDPSSLGICPGTIPSYMDPQTEMATFVDELMMVVGYTFANHNMANYPPSNTTALYRSCGIFANQQDAPPFGGMKEFFLKSLPTNNDDHTCWNMSQQLPTGHDATITSGDWSGVGTGGNGESWDFQTCTLLVEHIGFSKESMFPPRDWTIEWLQDHCFRRFGVVPDPYFLVRRWHFDDLVGVNASRILFTNGLKDGWSVGGFPDTLSDTLPVLNFPNGAHHSDLSGKGPTDDDTDDIKQGFHTVIQTLAGWLDDIKPPSLHDDAAGIRGSLREDLST